MSVVNAKDSFNRWPSALCAQTDPELFFPEKGGSSRQAKKICGRCVYSQGDNECLEDALKQPDSHGVRGGTSERERRKIMQLRRKASA